MNYNIVLYSRLSNEDVNLNDIKQESNSITNQKALLQDYVKSKEEFRNANIIEKFDDGYSGANLDRPAIKEVLEMVENREVNCIIVKDLSRFLRNDLETIYYLDEIFPLYDVRIISIGDKYDSNDYIGQGSNVNIVFRSIANRMYIEDLSKKVKQGQKQKVLNGGFVSSVAPFGYQKSPENKNQLIIEEETAKIVRYIFKLALKDMSTVQIAYKLNEENIPTCSQMRSIISGKDRNWNRVNKNNKWIDSKVNLILNNQFYIGDIVYRKTKKSGISEKKIIKNNTEDFLIYENAHEPIISKKDFYKVKDKLKEKSTPTKYTKKSDGIYLFSQKLKCKQCNKLLTRRKNKRKGNAYFCPTKYQDKNNICLSDTIYENNFSSLVLDTIKEVIVNNYNTGEINTKLENLNLSIKKFKKDILSKEKTLTNLKDKGMKAYDKYKDDLIDKPEYLLIRNDLNSQKNEITSEIETLNLSRSELNQDYEKLSTNQNYKLDEFLKTETLTREIVEQLIDCIYVNNDLSIEIDFNFTI